MDRLQSALAWSGTDVTLSMFVLLRSGVQAVDHVEVGAPERSRAYVLEDEANVLRGLHVVEYDLIWPEVPIDLARIVTECLTSALEHGAVLAWFGFEGSFDFEYLLHSNISGQIYAVAAAGDTVRLALDDDYRLGEEWRQRLVQLRGRILEWGDERPAT